MSFDAQRLYDLLPAILRIRDTEFALSQSLLTAVEAAELAGLEAQASLTSEQQERLHALRKKRERGPLKSLLGVIAEQVAVHEENLEQLYEDQFIETCQDWVVPYIGDLIGYRLLHGVAPKISSPRAEVANTIGFRRRKGTAAMLEQLARDVTGWNARVVEFFQLLATTQYMNHICPGNFYAPDLRRWEPLERLDSAFDSVAHTVEVRRITTGGGRYNIPNIGIFLWRLHAYSLTDSPGFRLDDRRWFFSPLGNNALLFTRPQTEDEITHLAEPINVPLPISRRVLHEYLDIYYGKGKSLVLNVDGQDIPSADIVVCNLSDFGGTWAHLPPDGKYAIDPVLGRIALPGNLAFPVPVRMRFHYGFSTEMGGGEYEHRASFAQELDPVQQVSMSGLIQNALNAVSSGGAVEIIDSGRYEETLTINVDAKKRLELRAANEHRPMLALSGEVQIISGGDAEVSLNGLLISGAALRVPAGAGLQRLTLRHCTLVPGSNLKIDGTPQQPAATSLIIEEPNLTLEIDRCIVGCLRVVESAKVVIKDSIVDATGITAVAYCDTTPAEGAGGELHIENSTVIGKVYTVRMDLASNCIFLAALAAGDSWTAPVRAAQKQTGCVRFSYLPLNSVVPRRFRCQPRNEADALRVRPQFTSLRYGDPGYGQLTQSTAQEIRTGADDEAEMGVFHHLYQAQRETNLRVRLDEYLRFSLEAGLFYVT